jgi:hypothetical protein
MTGFRSGGTRRVGLEAAGIGFKMGVTYSHEG